MLKLKLLFAGLILASVVGSPKELLAKDIVIVAMDKPRLHWELQGTPSTGPLKLPVKVGDVLHFVFSDNPNFPHGITTQRASDEAKVQKRGESEKGGLFLQELGEGPTQFGPDIKITPSKPNQELTQLKVLSAFPRTLNLMCTVHLGGMLITLERSD